MVITRVGFSGVVANAYAGIGLPADAPTVHEFPMEMFSAGSDLTPLKENLDKIIYGLTGWQPSITAVGTVVPPMVTVQGRDYQEALDNMNMLFLKNMWSDGLPIVPATEARVAWIMTGTDLVPDTVISPPGGVVPRGGIATVESIAVALAMAGGRPEYLPLLIASVQAITEPSWGLQAANSTTGAVLPAIVVNGPMARQIRLASGYGMLGSDPIHPAGAVVGRALRLVMLNLGGGLPGVGTMSIHGAMRTTNVVFAEDEEGLPPGWNSVAVGFGFTPDQNVVTASPIGGGVETIAGGNHIMGTKEGNDAHLFEIAKIMGTPGEGMGRRARIDDPTFARGIVLIGRNLANTIASDSGYSKLDTQQFLWENSKIPWSTVEGIGHAKRLLNNEGYTEGEDIPVAPRPEQIMLVVAGGDQGGHGYWLPVGGNSGYKNVSIEIQLPENWDKLIEQSEVDLGPLPSLH